MRAEAEAIDRARTAPASAADGRHLQKNGADARLRSAPGEPPLGSSDGCVRIIGVKPIGGW